MRERVAARAWSPFSREVADLICLRSAGGNLRPRMHARTALVAIRSRGVIRVESRRSVVVENRCLLIVPPWSLYGFQALDAGGSSTITVLLEVPETCDAPLDRQPALLCDPTLLDAWTALVDDNEQTVSRIERPRALGSLIEHCIAESTPIPAPRASGWLAPLYSLRAYMRAHLNEAIHTTALVERSGLTASHCIRAFGRQFGLPPHAYHMQMRLAEACELLAQGWRATMVAYDCGFADQSHLSRKFKEAYGLAPAAWAVAVARTVMNTDSGHREEAELAPFSARTPTTPFHTEPAHA